HFFSQEPALKRSSSLVCRRQTRALPATFPATFSVRSPRSSAARASYAAGRREHFRPLSQPLFQSGARAQAQLEPRMPQADASTSGHFPSHFFSQEPALKRSSSLVCRRQTRALPATFPATFSVRSPRSSAARASYAAGRREHFRPLSQPLFQSGARAQAQLEHR